MKCYKHLFLKKNDSKVKWSFKIIIFPSDIFLKFIHTLNLIYFITKITIPKSGKKTYFLFNFINKRPYFLLIFINKKIFFLLIQNLLNDHMVYPSNTTWLISILKQKNYYYFLNWARRKFLVIKMTLEII